MSAKMNSTANNVVGSQEAPGMGSSDRHATKHHREGTEAVIRATFLHYQPTGASPGYPEHPEFCFDELQATQHMLRNWLNIPSNYSRTEHLWRKAA
ncbi:MAG: hypothetical protein ACTHXA_01760 [Gulosibacter sp.]|uniref:hypothetical protein n=1 Tax=Gulosibacter sp. TaxID=2817531 RepID=UPI003F8F606B